MRLSPHKAALLLAASASALRPTRRTWLAGSAAAVAPLVSAPADAAPATTKVGRGMRAVGTRIAEPNIAALGISWGGASRRVGQRLFSRRWRDAVDSYAGATPPTRPALDGGTGEFATAQPGPNQRAGSAASRRCVSAVSGQRQGLLRVGLYSETCVAAETFALLARAPIKMQRSRRPPASTARRGGSTNPCMYDTVRIKPGTGLPPSGRARARRPRTFFRVRRKNQTRGAINAAARRRFVCRQERPGPDLDFALSFAPSDGKGG